ncbi:hypothetical protein PC129_g12235 [Phytophthora cactorum]|nr:hypothetical protein Pcac1_g18 [Phytophthora cactorum]KAG3102045.1 hypothetical protein PI125_g14287 [Phytophthora idaei]KAG2815316.1 hypothetical protein PC112_g13932 [Phytophthora cactorum]KAG2817005.1 hypothetical protein PC111_g12898 [Phytophthora cactorum]KAG2853314.1 hypothetical protein PC113_g14270 [Phytophthora cactorum]
MPTAVPASPSATSPPAKSDSGMLSKTWMTKPPVALGSFAAWFQHHPPRIPSGDDDARVEIDGVPPTSLRKPSYEGRNCKPMTSISGPQPHPARATVAWRGAR